MLSTRGAHGYQTVGLAVTAHRPPSSSAFVRSLALALALAGAAGGCAGGRSASGGSMHASTDDPKLTATSDRFLAEYLRREPVAATQAGDHAHDGAWPDLSKAHEADLVQFLERTKAEVAAIPAGGPSEQARVDREILATQLDAWLFSLRVLRPAEENPLHYTTLLGDGLDPLLTRGFGTRETRLASLASRLDGIGAVVAAARARLARPPRVHTETALAQAKGLVGLVASDVPRALEGADPALRGRVEAAAVRARAELAALVVFLENELLPRSDGDFRLGRAKFTEKLRFELDDDHLDVDALARDARELLRATQVEMAETALELHKALFPGEPAPAVATAADQKALVVRVLGRLSDDRSDDATIVRDATRTLDEATAFVRQKDLVRVPDEPCRVIEMPEYRRGVAIAYCDASGPLEAKPETFYAISPTPSDWSRERATSFYREYNRSMLLDLTVHEAMPGHFLQLMHNNRFSSRLRGVFSSGAFVEGWAVYAEWLMSHHGFGGARVRLSRQKMLLRVCANAVLDHGVHAGGLDEAGALAFLRDEAFQEEGEAVGKWKRARLTGAQLTTYYYGFSEMMRLRAAAEKKPGFTERAYHDTLLSFGSPPLRHARALMATR